MSSKSSSHQISCRAMKSNPCGSASRRLDSSLEWNEEREAGWEETEIQSAMAEIRAVRCFETNRKPLFGNERK